MTPLRSYILGAVLLLSAVVLQSLGDLLWADVVAVSSILILGNLLRSLL